VGISWIEQTKKFKSPLPVVAGFLLKSRESKAAKCRRLRDENSELKRQLQQQSQQLQQQEQEIARFRRQVQELEMWQYMESTRWPIVLPDDPPIGSHGYGARMVTLSANLARSVGLRGAARVVATFFKWLGIQRKTPDWTTIRGWLGRLGVAAIDEPMARADDWIWMADHSNQIGPEKTLVILGVRASQLPEPGTALRHEDVRVVTVQPGTRWKREDMAKVYDELAERFGAPRAVLIDGAVELREGADCLKKRRPDTMVLRDFKHYAANVLKSLVGNDERFKAFSTHVGRTRSAIQQTELAHLTPPGPKPKARFMNLAATLRWAGVVLWLLEHPQAKSREGLTEERLEEKLGWLREFGDNLAVWQECQRILSSSVTFINEQGLYRGAAAALRAEIATSLIHETSKQLAERLLTLVEEAEQQLNEGERLPMSTEILESSFSLYKQLERQHSKGGFTSLLTTFGALLKPTTPAAVKKAFAKVSNQDVRQWVAENLGMTLISRRRATYTEYANATKLATIQPAPT
jgi:hypothetical protein